MTDSPPRCAVLLLAHSGPQGLLTYVEALKSFCNPCEIGACFVMDTEVGVDASMDETADVATAVARPRTLITACTTELRCCLHVFVASPTQAENAGEAMNELARQAMLLGYTHAVVAGSNERLCRRSDGQMCEHLPSNWKGIDVMQIASDSKHKPLVDALVRLSAVRFFGTLLPAPIPIVEHPITAAWPFEIIATSSRSVTPKQIRRAINTMWECMSDAGKSHVSFGARVTDYYAFELTLFSSMLPDTSMDLDMLLDDRLSKGEDGWCGSDGLYFAARLAAERATPGPRCLLTHLLAAEIGLEQIPPRVEALHALTTYIRKNTESPNIAGLLAGAAAGSSTAEAPATWMGDASSAQYGIRDEIGVAAYGMLEDTVRQRVSYPNLLACTTVPAATFEPRIQSNYAYVAQSGDGSGARVSCPGPVDALLPTVVIHDDFLTGLPASGETLFEDAVLDQPRGSRWSWLLTLYENAVYAPSGLVWDNPPARLDVAAGVVTPTFCAARGYAVVLVVSSPQAGSALQILRHVATDWSRIPCEKDVQTEVDEAALALDAGRADAWMPCSSIELSPGRLVAIRAGVFYRFVSTVAANVSLLVARTRFAANDPDASSDAVIVPVQEI